MLLDHIEHIHRHADLHPLFREAFAVLAKGGHWTPGRHDVGTNGLFLFASQGATEGGSRMEAHRSHLDIHFTLDGADHFGWKPLVHCGPPDAPFDVEKDVWTFADAPVAVHTLLPGQLAIVWPEDVHAPLYAPGTFRKLVIKVPIDPS